MLRRIRIVNWRSHRDTTLTFSPGTNLFVGRLGGGKTSVVDALCYGLFGTCPAVLQRLIGIRDLIRNRPNGENSARVEVDFDKGGQLFRVVRILRRDGAPSAEVMVNGTRVQGPRPKDVDRYITEILGIDVDLFMRAVYAQQNQLDYLLTLAPRERKAKIDELLGLTRFEEVRQNTTKAANKIAALRAAAEQMRATAKPQQLEQEIAELEVAIKKAEVVVKRAEAQLEEIGRLIERDADAFAQLENKRAIFKSLRERQIALQQQIATLKSQLKEVDLTKENLLERALEAEKKNSEAVRAELRNIESTIDAAMQRLSALRTECFTLEEKVKTRNECAQKLAELLAGRQKDAILDELKQVEKKCEQLNLERARALTAVSELNLAITELRKEFAKCPVCDSPLSAGKRAALLRAKEELLREEQRCAEALGAEILHYTKILKGLEEKVVQITNFEEAIAQLAGVDAELEKARVEVSSAHDEVEGLKHKRSVLQLALEKGEEKKRNLELELAKIKDALRKRDLLHVAEKELTKVEGELSVIKFDEGEWETAQRRLSERRIALARAMGVVDNARAELRHLQEKHGERHARLSELRQLAARIERCDALAERLQRFANALADVQVELRGLAIEEINAALQSIWGVLYPYPDFTSLRLHPTEDDYALEFAVGGAFVPIDGIASGGERALACLALRIALALVLAPQVGWIILDEPTHNLDEEAVRTLATTLRDHVPKLLEQAIVITHDEGLKDAASEKIFRFNRDKEIPEITIVEEI